MSFIAVWIGLLVSGTALTPFISFISPDPTIYGYMGVFSGIMTIGLPFLALFFLIIRFFGPYRLKRIWRRRLRAFWALNILVFACIAANFMLNHQNRTEIDETYALDEINSDTLNIQMDRVHFRDNSPFHFDDLSIQNKKLRVRDVRLKIKKTDDHENVVVEKKITASGKNYDVARKRANEVDYDIAIDRNEINLPSYFSLDKGEKYMEQSVLVTLYVPQGKVVNLSPDVKYHLYSSSFDNHFDLPRHYEEYSWVMSEDGLVSNDWIRKIKYVEEIDIDNFSGLSIEGNIVAEIIQSNEFGISIEGSEEYVKILEKVKVEESLYFSTDLNRYSKPLKISVRMPELKILNLRNTGKTSIMGFVQKDLELQAVNSGDIKAILEIDYLKLEIDGRTVIDLEGKGQSLDVALFDGASIEAVNYIAKKAYLRGMHHSKNKISVSDTIFNYYSRNLDFKIFGSPEIIADIRD